MNIKMPGDKTRAACESCQKFTTATWNYGDFETNDGIRAKDVMQAYCDACGESLLLSQQSVYKLRKERIRKQRTSLNLTAPLRDLAYSCVSQLGGEPEKGPELIIKTFLLVNQESPETTLEVLRSIEAKLLKGKKNQKVDVTFPSEMIEQLDQISRTTGYKRSEVMRRAIWASQRIPEVNDNLKKHLGIVKTGILRK